MRDFQSNIYSIILQPQHMVNSIFICTSNELRVFVNVMALIGTIPSISIVDVLIVIIKALTPTFEKQFRGLRFDINN